MSLHGAALVDLVDAAAAATEQAGLDLCDAFCASGERFIRQNTPVETTRLRDGWDHTDAVSTGTSWRAFVLTDVDYAPYVEEGTGLWGPRRRKYKIEPKTPGGVLSFRPYLRADGAVVLDLDNNPTKDGRVFAKFVMHPGSPGAYMTKIGVQMAEHDEPVWSAGPLEDWARRVEQNMRRVARAHR